MEQIVGLLKLRSDGTQVPDERIIRLMRDRKLDFIATDDNLQSLRGAGASEDILAVVREISPAPAPPPPPPKPTTGTLALTCLPRECNVQVDSGAFEPTNGGVMRKNLPAGKHALNFTRAGFASEARSVEINAGSETALTVNLKPDEATRRSFGYAMFQRMASAVGDENAPVDARGSWTVQKSGGLPDEWAVGLRLLGTQGTVAVRKSSGAAFELSCQGETCQARKPALLGGKQLKGDDAVEVETALKVFRRYNLTSLLRLLRSRVPGSMSPSSESELAGPDGRYRLHLEGATDIFDIELDRQYQPLSLVHRLKLDANARVQALYTDYMNLGKIRYPKETQIKVADTKVGIIQVRLDSFPAIAK